jgi:hypothetical protein
MVLPGPARHRSDPLRRASGFDASASAPLATPGSRYPPLSRGRAFADRTAKHRGERPTGVGAGQISAGNQRIGLLGAPLVSPQRRALSFRGRALRGVEPGPRHRDLHSAKGPQKRARSVTVPVASDTARAIVVNRHRTGALHDSSYLFEPAFRIIARRVPIGADRDPAMRQSKQAE